MVKQITQNDGGLSFTGYIQAEIGQPSIVDTLIWIPALSKGWIPWDKSPLPTL